MDDAKWIIQLRYSAHLIFYESEMEVWSKVYFHVQDDILLVAITMKSPRPPGPAFSLIQ